MVDEEHVSGMYFGDMPTQMTALSVYRVTNGKITRLMLLMTSTGQPGNAERKLRRLLAALDRRIGVGGAWSRRPGGHAQIVQSWASGMLTA